MGDGGIPCPAFAWTCAGGDGGPGIVQFHTPSLADIIPPGGLPQVAELSTISRPSPVGFDELEGVWDAQLLPSFGRISRAQSKWIPLGAVRVAPGTSVPEAIEFMFQGVDPLTGFVETTAGIVDPLPAILTGTLSSSPITPYIEDDGVTVVFDITSLVGANDIYRRNPNLTQLFEVTVTNGTETRRFEAASVEADELAGELRLTVAALANGVTLDGFGVGATVSLIPRFFGISTEGIEGFLPDSATLKVSFQAAPRSPSGSPAEMNATPLTTNISDLTSSPDNTDFQFIRFVIEFDIGADMLPISFSSPLPSLDFLRVPFRF